MASLVYDKGFRGFTDAIFSPTQSPTYAGSVALDKYGQAYTYKQDSVSDSDTLYMLDADDVTTVWSTTKLNFRDTYIVPTYPTANTSMGFWTWHLLPGGEYLLACLDTLETRTYYALFSVNDGAAPTLIRVFFKTIWQRYRFGTAFIANSETYDDPIIIAYEDSGTTNLAFDVIPSVNEFLSNDVSAWVSGTTHTFATGEIPKIEGTSAPIGADSTVAYIFTLSKDANSANPQFFKVPEDNDTNLHMYLDKATISYQLANTGGGVNAWVKNVVGPANDQCIITYPFGEITAAGVRPTGSSSTATLAVGVPFVNTTMLPSLPNEGTLTLTTGVPTTRINAMFSTSTVKLGNKVFLPLFVFSEDVIDGESGQPAEDLVQYVRVYNYVLDGSVLTLDDTAEGSLFNNTEYGTANPYGATNFWDIFQASALLTSSKELLILGTVHGAGSSQRPTSVFLSGFGDLINNKRRLTQIL